MEVFFMKNIKHEIERIKREMDAAIREMQITNSQIAKEKYRKLVDELKDLIQNRYSDVLDKSTGSFLV